MSVNLTIKLVQGGGREFPISAELTSTIAELKEKIAVTAEMPKENIRLVCAGKIWQDVAALSSYEPQDNAIVHCLNNPPRNNTPATAQTLTQANPMDRMLGGSLGGAALQPAAAGGDPFAQMMAQSQQMMAQNPEMMQQLIDSPMMQNLMSNPEMMRSMVRMNPQLNQLMEERPELARMLEDPEVMRQSMQMIRNPSLMREMQRNSDRAIGHLDVMPGGHAALARAHEDMVDPLMAALSGSNQSSETAANLEAYAQQTEGSSNREALPNPWGPPSTSPAPVAAATPVAAAPAASPFGAAPPALGAQAANPMAGVMEQMMSNPAMMQQSMQMMNQMFGGQQANGVPALADTTPAASPSPLTAPANPFAGMMQQIMSNPGMQNGGLGYPAPAPTQQGASQNPFGGMMQQMMSNPAMMQQSMQMAQQMFGNQAGPFNAAAAPPADNSNMGEAAVADPAQNAFVRARFAAQLAQLSAMGFCNEAACLRALQQHQGRVDAAIDHLLTSGDA